MKTLIISTAMIAGSLLAVAIFKILDAKNESQKLSRAWHHNLKMISAEGWKQ